MRTASPSAYHREVVGGQPAPSCALHGHQQFCTMDADSASDPEHIVDAIFDDEDEPEGIETVMNCAAFMVSSLMQVRAHARIRDSRTIIRGPCSWISDYLTPHPK